jgi:N-glycosylase/DNA lyase
MEKLCISFGPLIGRLDSKDYYDMPTPEALSQASVEPRLRQLGFGYRAKYIYQTAAMVSQEHHSWLDDLRNPESPRMGCKFASAGEMLPGGRQGYRSAHARLLTLQGVGPKVADCVCLMGLGWGEAVPVDTHGSHEAPFKYSVFSWLTGLHQCGR